MNTITVSVAEAGATLGFWTIKPYPETSMWKDHGAREPVRIVDPDGREFHIRTSDGRVSVLTLPVELDRQTEYVLAGEATCDASREPTAIAKSLHSRFVAKPEIRAMVDAARAKLQGYAETRQRLRAVVAEMTKHGYRVLESDLRNSGNDTIPSNALWDCDVWKQGAPLLTARADGTFEFRRHTLAFRVADLTTVLGLVQS